MIPFKCCVSHAMILPTTNSTHIQPILSFHFFTIMLYYTTGYIVCVSVFVFMVYRASFLYNTLIDYTVY